MGQPDADILCEVLPGGLTLLLCETHLSPVAELQIWARVGSADERPFESGLAHFHEHMLFKGTERRGVGEVAGEVEGAGGRINAFTTFDATAYHATLPSDQLGIGVDVLCDAVLHSVFDPEELGREIEVVLEEIRRSEDAPSQVLGNALFAETWRVHPYRAPILGTPESVASFDRQRVRSFFERWYTRENFVVVAAGDFDAQELAATLRERLAEATAGGAARERPAEPVQDALRSVVLARPFERARLEFAYRGVSLADPAAPHLDLLAFILGSCESSRLVQQVKEHDDLVDRIDASCYTPVDPGCFSVGFDTDAERAEAAIVAAVHEVERLRREDVSEEELEKARTNFLAAEHFERESVSGMALKLGSFHVFAGDYRIEQRYLEAVRTATAADLRRAAERHLSAQQLTVAALLPEAEAAALDADRIARAVQAGLARTARVFAAPRHAAAPAGLESFELAGGAALHVVPRRGVPVVAARAALAGGLLAEDKTTSGLSSFLSAMWMRGTQHRSTAGFARAAESRGVEIDSFSGRSSQGLTFEAPSERVDDAIALLCEALLEPAFDPGEIERERRDTLAAIERREDRLAQRAFLLFAETHYRHHPYRHPMLGNADCVSRFDREKLAAQHDRIVAAPNLVIAVAGDVDPEHVAARFGARLADLPAEGFSAPCPAVEETPHEIRQAAQHKDRAQAHLVIGFRGLTVRDEDRFALEVISQLLAGQGGRLFLELRDRRSLAYSVSASNVEGTAPGYFSVYIATAPEKFDEARSGLLDELRGLLDAAPAEDELERAVRYLVGSFAIEQQRNAAHAAHTCLDALYGLGPDASRHYAERVRAVSREDVLRVARRIIDLDAYTLAAITP